MGADKRMRVAIIGSGLAGLSLALRLAESGQCQVSVFTAGEGASSVASGLLHPYPGEQGRCGWMAREGLEASLSLLDQAEEESGRCLGLRGGIYRFAPDVQLQEQLESYPDVERREAGWYWIRSGVTVHCQHYLAALREMIVRRGGEFVYEQVGSLEALQGWDQVVVAAGYGVRLFAECHHLRYRQVKGQIWRAEGEHGQLLSLIGKGYVAVESPQVCYVGATYERVFTSHLPRKEEGLEPLLQKIEVFFPGVRGLTITDCRAGVRITPASHYKPIVEKIGEKAWVFTGLGSRGLLYHAYLANLLSKAVLCQQNSCF